MNLSMPDASQRTVQLMSPMPCVTAGHWSSSSRREGAVLGEEGEREGGMVSHARRRMPHAARASQQEGGISRNLLHWAADCSPNP